MLINFKDFSIDVENIALIDYRQKVIHTKNGYEFVLNDEEIDYLKKTIGQYQSPQAPTTWDDAEKLIQEKYGSKNQDGVLLSEVNLDEKESKKTKTGQEK